MVIFFKGSEEYLERMRGVFVRLRLVGLRLKFSKCFFFKKRLYYLGYIVFFRGVELDLGKI